MFQVLTYCNAVKCSIYICPFYGDCSDLTNDTTDLPLLFLFVLFRVFSSHSRIFQSFGDLTGAGEGLKILTYPWHAGPVSSEGSLAYHIYCDRLLWSSPRTNDTLT